MSPQHAQKIKEIFNGFLLNDSHYVCKNVRSILDSISSIVSLNSDQYFDVRIILSELLQNAIEHGNKCIIQRKVHIKIFLNGENALNITVKDQGKGFNVCETLQKELGCQAFEVKELPECGRGLQIVKSLCDSIVFNRRGNKITVLKKLF